jgi:hypothetical protein
LEAFNQTGVCLKHEVVQLAGVGCACPPLFFFVTTALSVAPCCFPTAFAWFGNKSKGLAL